MSQKNRDDDKQLVVIIELNSDQYSVPENRISTYINEHNYEVVGRFSANYSGFYDNRKKDLSAFERTVKSALLHIRQVDTKYQQPVGLLFTSFEVFEYDASLPVIDFLLNSLENDEEKHPLYFMDIPEAGIDKLRFLAQVYQRRSDRRSAQKEPVPSADRSHPPTTDSDHHLTEAKNRLLSRLGKYQRRLLDRNNMAALREVGTLEQKKSPRGRKSTLMDIAVQLEKSGITTSTGKLHTPKSVSRLKTSLREVELRYHPNPAREAQLAQRAGLVVAPPPTEKKVGRPDKPATPTIGKQGPVSPNSPVGKSQPSDHLDAWKDESLVVFEPSTLPDSAIPDFGDDDKITLHLREEIPNWIVQGLSVKICNNFREDHRDFYCEERSWPEDQRELTLDIPGDTYLLPGRHYVHTFYEGKPIGKFSAITLYRHKLGIDLRAIQEL